jgi:uncharacterized membrane protein
MVAIFDVGKVTRHYFERESSNEYHIHAWSHLGWWFLRRSKCKNLTDNGHQVMGKSHMSELRKS